MSSVLVIDDNEGFCRLLCTMVHREGYEAVCAYTLKDGLGLASSRPFDVIFLDVLLPDGNGLERLNEFRELPSSPEVIILTGAGTADGAELAIKSGAWDYIPKPSSVSTMRLPLIRAIQYREEKLKKREPNALQLEGIIGSSGKMKRCYELVAGAAATDANVLITGETGTGKELFAKAIHNNSRRADKRFVVIDCAALQETLTESILFGYEKGAFTGAVQSREGLVKQGDGGTLFLDEIGELPYSTQKSFLRFLQEHRFRPVGAAKEIDSDFRLIAATNRDLDQLVRTDRFREDLLFRLRTMTIHLPPLRDHREDIEAIAEHYTAKICRHSGLEIKTLSQDFLDALLAYHWPGNVRELISTLERAVVAAASSATLFRRHLPNAIRVQLARAVVAQEQPPGGKALPNGEEPRKRMRLKELREATYERVEKEYLQELLKETDGHILKACKISGISRARLYQLMKKHGVKV